MRKKGFTLIELLVVIAIIAMLLAILMPALNKVKKIAQRLVCGTNSKGLGTAQMVYANDYEGAYVVQYYQGHTISDRTYKWQDPAKNCITDTGNLSVGASLYLLVREADVSPKSFVCAASSEKAYDGENSNNLDITELWDFGNPGMGAGSVKSQSYSYHNPYTRFAADDTRSAAFAVLADRNPWYDEKLTRSGSLNSTDYIDGVWNIMNYWDPSVTAEKWTILRANAQPHERGGQNVLFGDGHNSFEKTADIGVNHDNIYSTQNGNTPMGIRRGAYPPPDYPLPDPAGSNDSFLVNDIKQ